MQRARFSFRAFVSTIMVWTFVTLVLSGIVLYIAPPGRIAHWTDWTFVGLTKDRWQAVHTLAALLFLLAGFFHLLKFNWGAFKAYLRRSREAARPFRGAVLGGTAVFTVVLAGTLVGMPPFSSVMDLGERATNGWAAPAERPPVPHFELKTLEQASGVTGLSAQDLVERLRGAGLKGVQPDVTLRELADLNGRSPMEVYALFGAHPPRGTSDDGTTRGVPSHGLGRMTVAAVGESLGLTPDTAVKRLAEEGIQAAAGETLRDVAGRARKRPDEILAILQGPTTTSPD